MDVFALYNDFHMQGLRRKATPSVVHDVDCVDYLYPCLSICLNEYHENAMFPFCSDTCVFVCISINMLIKMG